jgi:hypothetical protein
MVGVQKLSYEPSFVVLVMSWSMNCPNCIIICVVSESDSFLDKNIALLTARALGSLDEKPRFWLKIDPLGEYFPLNKKGDCYLECSQHVM